MGFLIFLNLSIESILLKLEAVGCKKMSLHLNLLLYLAQLDAHTSKVN